MTEIEWWDYDDADEMAAAVAGDIGFIIESAIDARGAAVIALAGGKTPLPIYDKLAAGQARLEARDDHPRRRAHRAAGRSAVERHRDRQGLPAQGRAGDPDRQRDRDRITRPPGRAADALLQDLHWPLDLCLLGVGARRAYRLDLPRPRLRRGAERPQGAPRAGRDARSAAARSAGRRASRSAARRSSRRAR